MVNTDKIFNPKLEKFSEYLKNCNGKLWNEATNHKFTSELKNDKLEDHIFKKYIIQDYIFIETLVTLIGKAVYISPNMNSKIKWANFLYAITSDENNYFQRSFDALDVSKEERTNTKLFLSISDFSKLMHEVANTGTYEEILAVILAAEWVYYTWASNAKKPYPKRFYLSEWITLHNNSSFKDTVAWIKKELDITSQKLTISEQNKVANLFIKIVRLEVSFFDACYK
jgi:thiaminase/transcriptional activator TenA